MAKARNPETVFSAAVEVSDQLKLCHEVALALIETGQPWTTRLSSGQRRRRTDHDKARGQARQSLTSIIRQLKQIRRHEINPDAIRAACHFSNMKSACEQCAELNAKNLQAGRAFVCFAQQLAQHGMEDPCRFHLNEEGQIVERR